MDKPVTLQIRFSEHLQKRIRRPWNFSVEKEGFGRLDCSYYPDEAEEQIRDRFSEYDKEEVEIPDEHQRLLQMRTDYAVDLLYDQIQLILKDSLVQVVGETMVRVLLDLNGKTHLLSEEALKGNVTQLFQVSKKKLKKRVKTKPLPKKWKRTIESKEQFEVERGKFLEGFQKAIEILKNKGLKKKDITKKKVSIEIRGGHEIVGSLYEPNWTQGLNDQLRRFILDFNDLASYFYGSE